ncbi:MAG: ATP-binding cassette domain-containing protein [Desulfovibrio sp.]|jgi:molybdate transport system ATP-binding protein|nr:ATP-binding cassette domain-containing protein [Desulfovibrio sp.]
MKKPEGEFQNPSALMVNLDRVCAGFGRKMVFYDLSLRLFFKEHLALVGANGAGKSTLLALLQGNLRPVQDLPDRENPGKIYWHFSGEADASALSALECARLVSPAGQRHYLKYGPDMDGGEIILSGLHNSFMPYSDPTTKDLRRRSSLASAAGALPLLSAQTRSMSQGELRLCLILRALMGKPALLLLDEPFDGLDAQARDRVAHSLDIAVSEDATLLVSAHRLTDIPPFIREALLAREGRVSRHSLSALPPPYQKTAHQPEDVNGTVRQAQRRSEVADPTRRTSPAASPLLQDILARRSPLLRLHKVRVFIERKLILRDIDWIIQPGEQWLVSGRNGAGKSTLLRLLYGDENAALGGTLSWCGRKRIGLEDLRQGVGYVSDRLQDLYDYDLCAEDIVISGLRGSIGLYREVEEEERGLARAWLERMGAVDLAAMPFHSLSSGNARRVILARALAGSPPVLLLDEPCSGLDPNGRNHFLGILPELAVRGVCLIYVSHQNDPVDSIFTHELHLDKGQVVYAGKRPAPG